MRMFYQFGKAEQETSRYLPHEITSAIKDYPSKKRQGIIARFVQASERQNRSIGVDALRALCFEWLKVTIFDSYDSLQSIVRSVQAIAARTSPLLDFTLSMLYCRRTIVLMKYYT